MTTEEVKPNALQLAMPSDRCAEFIERYRSHWKATAASYIALSETVKDAEDKLSKADLRIFHEKVGLDPKGSTHRKFISIADAAVWLREHVELLPSTWTTIYEISKCSDVERRRLLETGVINPRITADELTAALDKPKKKPGKAKPKAKAVVTDVVEEAVDTTTEVQAAKTASKTAAKTASKTASKTDASKPLVAKTQEAAVDAAVASPESAEDRVEIALPDFSRRVDAGDLGRVHNETVLIDLRNVSVSDCIAFVATLQHYKKGYGLDYTLGATIQQVWEDAGEEAPKRPLPEGYVPTDYMAVLRQA